jgi:hypothetical protein
MLDARRQWLTINYLRSHPEGVTVGEVGFQVVLNTLHGPIRDYLQSLVAAGDATVWKVKAPCQGLWSWIYAPTPQLLAREIGPEPPRQYRRSLAR